MESNVITEPVAPEASNVVEPRGHNDNPAASQHKEIETPEVKAEEPKKPESRIDTIKRAHAEIEAKNSKPEEVKPEQPKPEEKLEAKSEVKESEESAKQADEDERAAKTRRELRSESLREPPSAPSRFQPEAKEKWAATPQAVKFEIQRLESEYAREREEFASHKQFREELKDFEELSKRHNVPFKDALNNYVDIERKFSEDPATGFKQLCQNLGMTPPQAIGHILRSANVTPQQLIQHMQQDPSAYTSLSQRPMQQQPQQQQSSQRAPDPEVSELKAQVAAMREEQVRNEIIRPFAAEYPDYTANEDQIAKVLKSGIVDELYGSGLSPWERLEVAMRIAVPNARRATPSQAAPIPSPAAVSSPVDDLRGNKSVKGAPTAGTDGSARRTGKMSRTDALDAAWAELGLR